MSPGFGYVLLAAILPQLLLVGMAAVCALLATLRPAQRPDLFRWLAVIGFLGAVAASGFVLWGMRLDRNGIALSLWNGGLVVDHFSLFVTIAACVFGVLVCLVSDTYLSLVGGRSSAFFSLLLLATAGTSAVASQHEMATLFAALALVVLCLALLPALVKTEAAGPAAAWRHLIEAGVALGLVLYGLALLYGVSGDSSLRSLGHPASVAPASTALGAALVVLGTTLPLGLLPFDAWVRRTAAASPAVVAAATAVLGPLAGAAAVLRFGVSGLGAAVPAWTIVLAAVAGIGACAAAAGALQARRISQLVACAGSGQAAFLLIGVLAFGPGASGAAAEGPSAVLFGLLAFGLSSTAAFAALALLQNAGLGDRLRDLRGLGARSPAAALLLAFALASLAGLPPLGGFIARFFLVAAAVDTGYGWLAVVALVAAVASAVPLLRALASMYGETGDELPFTLEATPRLSRMTATWCCLATFSVTVLAQPLLVLARGGAGPLL